MYMYVCIVVGEFYPGFNISLHVHVHVHVHVVQVYIYVLYSISYIVHYHTQKKIKIEPRIKLNHNKYIQTVTEIILYIILCHCMGVRTLTCRTFTPIHLNSM